MRNVHCSALVVLAWTTMAFAQAQPASPPQQQSRTEPHRVAIELTTLNLMLQKGIITQAEYDSALRDIGESAGNAAENAPSLVIGKWSTTLYGFVEADHIYDTTQSFDDSAGNKQVAHAGTFAANNPRFMFGVRNSRIGFRLRAPEYHHIRASAQLEMDFLGNQPAGISEAQFWVNPGFRIRHMNLKIETPIFDVLIGQYWQLFGWQSIYHPNTVEIQGVPGQIYSRTPQIRLSKTVKTQAITFEAAVAIMRPPQRDSGYPEGQAGVRLAFNKWTGLATNGATGTLIQPLSIAVTGDLRRFALADFMGTPTHDIDSDIGLGIALDGLFPIVPARKDHKSNALTLNVEYAWSYGANDLYTGLNGGVSFPTNVPNPKNMMPPPTYTPNVDVGPVIFDGMGEPHLIQWQSILVGAQYALPALDGRAWISVNYSRNDSNNAKLHGAPNKTRDQEHWVDANLFGDLTPAVRLGLEYAWFNDHYTDGTAATNHRVQLSAFYLF
jgi:hypothetical protein